MFPVYVYEEDMELPEENTYYLVAGNGIWMHKNTGIIDGFVPVDTIAVLPDFKNGSCVKTNLPPLPFKKVWQIKEFFRRVVEKYKSESAVTLHYNKHTSEYRVVVSDQIVSGTCVRYKRHAYTHSPEMADFLCVGTIHSHCNFDAFHSGTDIGDEKHFDGLHCTFGHNDKAEFSITASLVVNGFRTKVDPLDVLLGLFNSREHFYVFDEIDEDTKQEWNKEIVKWMEHVEQEPQFHFWPRLSRDR